MFVVFVCFLFSGPIFNELAWEKGLITCLVSINIYCILEIHFGAVWGP